MIKDADEIALLRLAAQAADRVVAAIAAGRLVGRTEADVAHEVRERLVDEGHDVAHSRSSPRARTPPRPITRRPERVIGAGEPIVLDIGGDARRLRLGHHADAVGHRRRPGEGSRRALPPPVRRPLRGPGGRDRGRAARRRLRGDRRGGAAAHRRRGLRRGVLPPDRSRDRPRRPRGPVPDRGQRTRRSARGWHSRSSPGIYLVGEYGARIEDIVVCGPDGPIVLNEAPRELYVVDG